MHLLPRLVGSRKVGNSNMQELICMTMYLIVLSSRSSVVVDNLPVILATADHIVVLITTPLMQRRYRPPSFVSVTTDRR